MVCMAVAQPCQKQGPAVRKAAVSAGGITETFPAGGNGGTYCNLWN